MTIRSYAVSFGLALAMSTWIYQAMTAGITPDTWARSAFAGVFGVLAALLVLGLKRKFGQK
jgi:hypothetical protein